MVKLLVDTCVWLEIAKEPKQLATLMLLENLLLNKEVSLLVPRLVLDEFARNKNRIVEDCRKSLSTTLKKAKEVLAKFGGKRKSRRALAQLNDLDTKLPLIGEAVGEAAVHIEKLLKRAAPLECTDEIMLRAAKRAVDRIAPCHTSRNSINDAIILETYAAAIKVGKGERFGFVTLNKNDFGSKEDHRQPHPDIASLFSKIKSRYYIGLYDALLKIRPDMRRAMRDMMLDESHWASAVRSVDEIGNAGHEFFEKVWYNRHKFHERQIEQGQVKLVDTYTPGRNQRETVKSVWEGAKKSARKVEDEYGLENLGPWSDYEWGMLNGKLSALRWVMGDEWDMLDT